MVLVFVSFESEKDADRVANFLIEHHLAACITIFPTKSYYYWKRKKVHANEVEGIIKTTAGKIKIIQKTIEELLPYAIAQIIAVEAQDVNEKYRKWVESEVSEKWT